MEPEAFKLGGSSDERDSPNLGERGGWQSFCLHSQGASRGDAGESGCRPANWPAECQVWEVPRSQLEDSMIND